MLYTTHQKEMRSSSSARCLALRSELEATRTAFHKLLERASASGWYDKAPSSRWTVGQVFVHLTWALEYLPEEVLRARRGQGMFNLPKRLADPLSYWYIRCIARTATAEAIGCRYDRATDATLDALDTIRESDWTNGADFYGEGFHTVEELFHGPAQHLAQHTTGF